MEAMHPLTTSLEHLPRIVHHALAHGAQISRGWIHFTFEFKASTLESSTAKTLNPVPGALRRSSRNGRGTGGRDIQLDQLGDILMASTRKQKPRFMPDDPSLPMNPRAPPSKNKRRKKAPAAPSPSDVSPPQPSSLLPLPQPSPSLSPSPPLSQSTANSRFGFAPSPSSEPTNLESQPQDASDSEPSADEEEDLEEMEIDETSEGEDDHRAHEFLRATPTHAESGGGGSPMLLPCDNYMFAEISSDQLVLQQHHERNRTPKMPAPMSHHHSSTSDPHHLSIPVASRRSSTPGSYQRLSTPVSRQRSSTPVSRQRSSTPVFRRNSTTPVSLQRSSTLVSRQRLSTPMSHQRSSTPVSLQRSSTPGSSPSPPPETCDGRNTLDMYPPSWREVINNAKKSFRAYLAAKDGFPNPAEAIKEARKHLEGALEDFYESGRTVEPICDISQDMASLVYAESWNFRSQLKADIRVQVRNLRTLFPDKFTGQPEEYRAHIQDTISQWINDGSYLHAAAASSDAQVHFANPIIESTCKAFYFGKWAKISALDPESFRGSVPKPLIALVGTVYRNALDEWANGFPKTTKLESEGYVEVYDAILAALDEVEHHEIDGPLLKQRLASWAGFGASMNSISAPSRISTTICLKFSAP